MNYILFLLLFAPLCLNAQTDNEFLNAWINNSPGIEQYIDEQDLKISSRLGITYDGVQHKVLMNSEYERREVLIKELQEARSLDFEKSAEEEYEVYWAKSFGLRFYFKNKKYTSPIFYHTRDFKNNESKYFKFIVSDTTLYNHYSINRLDNFVDSMLVMMNFTSAEKELLKKEKIIYVLCKDENEIEKVAGVKSRGQYFVAYDAVVSTYNAHVHEVAHLLMNYRIKDNVKPALLFFLEGFAVATGGRGGINKNVLANIGSYLVRSGFVSYYGLLSHKGFTSEDASISYSIAGLYNRFLLEKLGFDAYLSMYKQYSRDLESLSQFDSSNVVLPPDEEFRQYLESAKLTSIILDEKDRPVGESSFIGDAGENYSFDINKSILFLEFTEDSTDRIKLFEYPVLKELPQAFPGYRSKLFEEHFPGEIYKSEKYHIMKSEGEINIYNYYTNELIDSYSAGFSLSPWKGFTKDGKFIFYVRKTLFDEYIRGMMWRLK